MKTLVIATMLALAVSACSSAPLAGPDPIPACGKEHPFSGCFNENGG